MTSPDEGTSQADEHDDRGDGDGRGAPSALGIVALAAAVVAVGVLAAGGLARDGLWDPLELDRAEDARVRAGIPLGAETAGEGAAEATPGREATTEDLGTDPLPGGALGWVATGFRTFGLHAWAGRLPLAMAGLLAAILAGLLALWGAGARQGLPALAVLVAGTSPGFLLNARTLLGDTPGMLAQALVGLAIAGIVLESPWPPARPGGGPTRPPVIALTLAAGVAIGFAAATRGVLLGVAPPLLAGTAVVLFRWASRRPAPPSAGSLGMARGLVTLGGLFVAGRVAVAVVADHAGGSMWVGGTPRGLEPPTFDAGLEHLFHGLGPLGALAVPALGGLLMGPADARGEAPSFRPFLFLWIACSFGATTLFTARFGPATHLLAAAPLAVAFALLLRDVADSRRGWPLGATIVAMLVFLLWRDLRLYPQAALTLLPVDAPEVPEGYRPRTAWTIALAAVGAVLVPILAIGPPVGDARPTTLQERLAAPYRLVRHQWHRGPGTKVWLGVIGAVVAGGVLFGVVALAAPEGRLLTSLGRRIGRGVLLGILASPVVLAVGQLAVVGIARLGRFRLLPVAVAALGFGAWFAFGFLPDLSARLSPRALYAAVEDLADEDEPIAVAGLGQQGSAYYLSRPVSYFDGVSGVRAFLVEDVEDGGRRWAAVTPKHFPGLDRDFRRLTGEHLFVAQEIEGTALLVATEPVSGVEDRNPLAASVLKDVPEVTHPVGAMLSGQVELVGYDLELPGRRPYVGAGQRFTVRWVWRVIRRIPGSYQVFVHLDGAGQRIHGDHEPVDGKYPVRLWEPGDVVVDEQEIEVPASHRPGRLTMWVGLYAGERRLEVIEGPEDGADRVRAGVVVVR